MARLSHGHANPDLGIYLSETTRDEQGHTLVCPECGHIAPAGDFGASGTSPAPDLGIYLSETTKDEQGHTLVCPECGHIAPAGTSAVRHVPAIPSGRTPHPGPVHRAGPQGRSGDRPQRQRGPRPGR